MDSGFNTPNPSTTLTFARGDVMKNRFMLAPMTNTQSHEDGTLSDEEFHWLTMRAKGQFGLVMTCASHVQEVGKGFSGQLGIFGDQHIPGHQRLAAAIKSYGSLAFIQLHHAGARSPKEVIGQTPVGPSDNEKYGTRGLSLEEVYQLRDDFISAAVRAQKAGYDGIEIHGAHGYIIAQFLSDELNTRTDLYGGSLENRSRLLFEIVKGVRQACGENILISVRLSPERFGMHLPEIMRVSQQLIDEGLIDLLDISLWDCFKYPEDEAYQSKPLLEYVTSLDKKSVRLTVAGKILSAHDVSKILHAGIDIVSIGRAGILHHDFPVRVMQNPNFEPTSTPVSKDYLHREGLGDNFIRYMHRWPDFVAPDK
jgi:2,4-dienoyl-CoA reductase-like NADH-dependent reductase (Old Yellow Enzyme family)